MFKGKWPRDFIGITQGYHQGKALDLGWNKNYGGTNAPVYSIQKGIVKKIQVQPNGGNVIFIEHDGGVTSVYAHLSAIIVKVGEEVNLYEQIGNIGNTGASATGYLVHLAIYSSLEAAYRNANSDIDPFEVLEVYEGQVLANGTQEDYGSKFKYHNEIETGLYITLDDINLRTEPNSYSTRVKYEDMTEDGKKNALYTNKGDNAVYKEGTRFDVLEIVKNENNQVFGRSRSGWLCLVGSYGVELCKKVD